MTRTVIDLDDALVASVAKELGTSTKKDTVHAALREVLANRRAAALTRLRDAATDGAFDLTFSGTSSATGDDRSDGRGWIVAPRGGSNPNKTPRVTIR
jgi:Arc/MetJ family transcription regulator